MLSRAPATHGGAVHMKAATGQRVKYGLEPTLPGEWLRGAWAYSLRYCQFRFFRTRDKSAICRSYGRLR